jgi:predicted amidohydrolase
MMTSKMIQNLCSLSFEITPSYQRNLDKLLELVDDAQPHSLIVAPEVCLTGYDYDNFDAVLEFAPYAIKEIKKHSQDKIIVLTLIEERESTIYNYAKVFYNGTVVYERTKARLFRFGNEHKYMLEGSDDEFEIVEIAGIKLAVFICFELRFKELWQRSEGADVIAVPSYWGVARTEHFKLLTQSLALINQCYVVASDAANEECSKMSGIITPQADVKRNEKRESLCQEYNTKEIATMRRYMDVGING